MRRLILLGVTAIYLASLLWAYRQVIVPTYEYQGYRCQWPDAIEFIWLAIISLLPLAFLPLRLHRPSGLVIWWLYVTVYIAAIWVPALSTSVSIVNLLPLQVSLFAAMGLLTAVSGGRLLRIPVIAVSRRAFWPALLAIWAACLIFLCAHFSLRGLIVNMVGLLLGGSEYTIRASFFEELSQTGRLLGYAGGLVGEALDPFLIAYGLVYGRRWLIAIGVFGQLVFFAVVGAKSILFSTLFLVLVLFLVRRFRDRFGLSLVTMLLAVVMSAAVVDTINHGSTLTTLTTRRTMIDPGLLTGFYFEYYSQTPHAGIAYHFPHGNLALPAPSYEIGLAYFGDERIDANANAWAEGFADFGIPGIFAFTGLIALMIWLYDSLARQRDLDFAVLLGALQAFALSNSAPMTVAITHGGVAVALLLWFLPRTKTANLPAAGEELHGNSEGEEMKLDERWIEAPAG